MIHRFLTLTQIPELRTEPGSPELGITDVEVCMPVEVLWQAEEIIKNLKYLKAAGFSMSRPKAKLIKLLRRYLVSERDRVELEKSLGAA